jgi:EAL domain-containing protein (putative c-di-GMP-specific phosphodiesterase class I)
MFQVLEELQQLGVRLAIDDFGTGYSNLNYLKQLPVSKLKIDRTFTQDLLPGSHDSAITAAIITMAKFLNLKVTAEGVETDEQLSVLHKYSCDEAQGFLLSKPLPETEISKVLEALKTT